MNRSFDRVVSYLPTTAGVAIASLALSVMPAVAVEVPQSAINGLYYPTGAQQFFEEGRRAFEREVQILIQGRLYSAKQLLEVSDELRMKQEILQLEKFKHRSGDRDSKQPHPSG